MARSSNTKKQTGLALYAIRTIVATLIASILLIFISLFLFVSPANAQVPCESNAVGTTAQQTLYIVGDATTGHMRGTQMILNWSKLIQVPKPEAP